jgi:calcineurin-like phosphoesterase family protein
MTMTEEGLPRHASFKGLRDDLRPPAADNAGSLESTPSQRPKAPHIGVPRANILQLLPDAVVPSKGALKQYWRSIASIALRYLGQRPLKLGRHTHRTTFYHRGALPPAAPGVRELRIDKREGGTGVRLWVDDLEGLLGLVDMGAVLATRPSRISHRGAGHLGRGRGRHPIRRVHDVGAAAFGASARPGMIFFTSDTHFGHGGALGLYGRPFRSIDEMDRALVVRWNATVRPADVVWHLGDFAIGATATRIAELLGLLHGEKHLIAGNNDPSPTREAQGWSSVADYAELTIDGVRLVLCHYPFRSWNGMGKGAVNLHGHSHGRGKELPRQIDVGADIWDFRPMALPGLLPRHFARARASEAPARGRTSR